MPAQVVVALDDLAFANQAVAELAARRYEAIALPSPLAALDALEGAIRVEVLIPALCTERGSLTACPWR
jgi:hypothetical protein